MIQKNTILKAADNSGAKKLKCVDVHGGYENDFASVGDIITCSVREADPQGTVEQGEVVKAVIVRQSKEKGRDNGVYVRFDENAAVVLEGDTKEPVGTRAFGPMARELRGKGFRTILSLAPEVL